MTLLDRLTTPGPKRILSLDGGGVRGIISLCYLERIETILRQQSGRPDLRLCDYFDLIGGTSTGAIIGAALAIGMEVAEIKSFYFSLGLKAFSRRQLNPFNALYNARPLQEILRDGYGDIRLGDDAVRTGLCVIVKRADTRSIWPLLNHPNGQYYERNGQLLLRNVVRASTAAPGYFKPEVINISDEKTGVFVDGGVSMANNPALQLFLIATLKGFPFRWKTGEDSLMLISVGTGSWEEKFNSEEIQNNKVWNWAAEVPRMLIEEGMWQTELILQLLSRTPTSRYLDREIGDLRDDLLTPAPLFHYLRYDVRLEAATVHEMGLPHLAELLPQIRRIDAAEYGQELSRIGELAAGKEIRPEHFPPGFTVDAPAISRSLSDPSELTDGRSAPISS